MPKKLYNEPSPLETKILSKRFHLENSERLDTYLANDGYKAFLHMRAECNLNPNKNHLTCPERSDR